jgi:hypothetical protein
MSESSYARSYTDDEIRDHIRRVADGDRPPTITEFNGDEQAPSATAAANHFGRWNDAIKAAGFEPREIGTNPPPNRISREELVSWLQAFKIEFGVWPNFNDIRQWPGPSETPYLREFDSWDDAIAAAKEGMSDA